ncbi:ATP-dependent Clp protease proteolytic subunit 6, chloroplastic [Vitis vinifera]|uniref:ATP-dependent Clp protease proteolytic subunit n=1 Tax=Vitis vinifera TaxID=29760 RepID=A0A438JTQ8_VITVI|nr:ATP-dependent Clp protease proteolytic subunit 6, chloroplastic [Vitis vinifera]
MVLFPGLSSKTSGLSLKVDGRGRHAGNPSFIAFHFAYSYGAIEAKKGNPPVAPSVMTPGGPLDLSTVLFRSRIIFIGQPINSMVAQRVISQLVTLAAIDEDADILMYLNCPGGSTYSVLAIYDCMAWIKPKVGTVCFGVAASQGALLLAGGEKGMRYAMPNARIMVHQPQGGCGGHVEDVRRQVNEAVQSRHKIDKMYAAFTGQPLEQVQQYTERDRFLSASELFVLQMTPNCHGVWLHRRYPRNRVLKFQPSMEDYSMQIWNLVLQIAVLRMINCTFMCDVANGAISWRL